MLKVLGGRCRSIPVVDGKVNLVLKAVVPAPADKEKAEKLCSLNGWHRTPTCSTIFLSLLLYLWMHTAFRIVPS